MPGNSNQPGQQPPSRSYGPPAVEIDSNFNFYDGSVYDISPLSTSDPNRRAEARSINDALPFDIQGHFNSRTITYYDPGSGAFYYTRMCTKGACEIVQVARSCDCYVSAIDKELHYLAFDEGEDAFQVSEFNSETVLPAATRSRVIVGDSLDTISEYYDVPVSEILKANPDIRHPDVIYPRHQVNIPAQAYTVKAGDSLETIADKRNISLSALEGLNSQIADPNFITPNEILKVPASNLNDPFAYSVEPKDTLFSITKKLNIPLPDLKNGNPQITDKNQIYPGQIVKVPICLPSSRQCDVQGKV